ncbi:MAG: metallophosphoesterase family protein [Candidatus Methylomirabilales bacterium]
MPTVLGVISDTHGVMRPEALEALRGVARVLHAGDVGSEAVLATLRALAPLTAVRGNADRGPLAAALPATASLVVAGVGIHLLHDVNDLDLDPAAAAVRVVVSGHTHRASIRWGEDVLYLNPGSAGPRRFGGGLSVARLTITAGRLDPEIIPLPV